MICAKCGESNPSASTFCGYCGDPFSPAPPEAIGIGTSELPMIGFIDAVKLGCNNFAKFSGRSTRAEFWWLFLGLVIFGFVTLILFSVISAVTGSPALMVIWLVLYFLSGLVCLSASCRRLHDTGRSGWWYLINWVPFGSILWIVWMCEKGDKGTNRYGPDPRQPT